MMGVQMEAMDELLQLAEDDTLSVELVCRLDGAGFLCGASESPGDYRKRLKELREGLSAFSANLAAAGSAGIELEPGLTVKAETRIGADIDIECEVLTDSRYGFTTRWVPAFFAEHNLGLLFAGFTLVLDSLPFPVFIIRRSFRKSATYLWIYSRLELLSHEKCHVARSVLNDDRFEEHFAYAVSSSRFRCLFGNCFRTGMDACLFAFPLLGVSLGQLACVVSGVQIAPIFWWGMILLAMLYPFFLLIRNFRDRHLYFKAERFVTAQGSRNAGAVLFRCTGEEIAGLGGKDASEVWRKLLSDGLRGDVIRKRFIEQGG